ncbi:MAG TPA: hypothetical protein VF733_02430 [Candidatus Saccharimonadales bacterium]
MKPGDQKPIKGDLFEAPSPNPDSLSLWATEQSQGAGHNYGNPQLWSTPHGKAYWRNAQGNFSDQEWTAPGGPAVHVANEIAQSNVIAPSQETDSAPKTFHEVRTENFFVDQEQIDTHDRPVFAIGWEEYVTGFDGGGVGTFVSEPLKNGRWRDNTCSIYEQNPDLMMPYAVMGLMENRSFARCGNLPPYDPDKHQFTSEEMSGQQYLKKLSEMHGNKDLGPSLIQIKRGDEEPWTILSLGVDAGSGASRGMFAFATRGYQNVGQMLQRASAAFPSPFKKFNLLERVEDHDARTIHVALVKGSAPSSPEGDTRNSSNLRAPLDGVVEMADHRLESGEPYEIRTSALLINPEKIDPTDRPVFAAAPIWAVHPHVRPGGRGVYRVDEPGKKEPYTAQHGPGSLEELMRDRYFSRSGILKPFDFAHNKFFPVDPYDEQPKLLEEYREYNKQGHRYPPTVLQFQRGDEIWTFLSAGIDTDKDTRGGVTFAVTGNQSFEQMVERGKLAYPYLYDQARLAEVLEGESVLTPQTIRVVLSPQSK